MKAFLYLSAVFMISWESQWAFAASNKPSISIPPENQSDTVRPSFETFEKTAQLLVNAINDHNQLDAAKPVFFPEEIFIELKDIPRADEYYQKLLKNFYLDIHDVSKKLKAGEKYDFVGFEPGRCVWKKIGSEFNKIAYWSCHKSKLKLKIGEKGSEVRIVSLINWGSRWYVTHLGKMR